MSDYIVIKIGGSIVSDGTYTKVLDDIKRLGLKSFVLVHGGG